MTGATVQVPSLAELRAMGDDEAITGAALGALLDIAEAALEWQKKSAAYVRCFDLQPYQESVADQLGAERDAAGARLALAAKGVAR